MASFDFIAPVYDWLATRIFGHAIRRAQTHYLNRIPRGARVLILGGGTGWILEEMPGPQMHIDYVDPSQKMLDRTRRRPVCFNGLRLIHGTEKNVAGQSYDVVITPFVLDICTEHQLPDMVSNVGQLLNKTGLWICIDFNSNDTTFKARLLTFAMCQFFRIVSGLQVKRLLPYFETIEKAGFTETTTRLFYGRFIKASVFQKPETSAAASTPPNLQPGCKHIASPDKRL